MRTKRARNILTFVYIFFFTSVIPANAIFGIGDVVFDPTLYANALQQLFQETEQLKNLAQQLQYAITNTTGGGAGFWSSNQALLSNLGGIISEANGLSYSLQGVGQQFQQYYSGNVLTVSPQATAFETLNTLNGALQSAQMQAANFEAEAAQMGLLEAKNQSAVGNLQALQVSNEIALAQVQQIQMMRQLAMASTNSANVAAAKTTSDEQQAMLNAIGVAGAPLSPNLNPGSAPPPPQ